ncbi:hypothetical protein PAEPH01_0732 [Pancytospora epiphaga]|nr:hypothetical protein PAEPH01_0732 [Pancytospora epiphaga]
MSSSDYCGEYIVGCCPYEEFAVQSLTKQCTRIHDENKKKEYAKTNNAQGFELEVLATYRNIIRDVDKKVAQNERCLVNVLHGSHEDIFTALEYTENIIDEKAVGDSATTDLYQLLKIHGLLLLKISEHPAKTSYGVCKSCGAITESSTCKHQFCPLYGKIRKLCKKLEVKLGLE